MKDQRRLFSVLLDPADFKRLEVIAAAKETTKSRAFREWLRNASRAIEAKQEQNAA